MVEMVVNSLVFIPPIGVSVGMNGGGVSVGGSGVSVGGCGGSGGGAVVSCVVGGEGGGGYDRQENVGCAE